MDKMTTITFEVPTEVLREANYYYPAKFYKTRSTDPEAGPEWLLENLARAGIVEAKDALPPPRIPVTKDTKWRTPIIFKSGLSKATFIAPHPTDSDQFIGLYDNGLLESLVYGHWFEAPKPKRVPVKLDQKRKSQYGEVGMVENFQFYANGIISVKVSWPNGTCSWHPPSDVEEWEVVE